MTGEGRGARGEERVGVPEAYRGVLREIDARLGGGGVIWAVTGSLGFALQGLPVAPRDVDLQTDAAGAYEFERRFAGCVTRPVAFRADERMRSHFGELLLDGVVVEIMGDIQKRSEDGTWEPPVNVAHHRRFVAVAGMRVPVLALEYEYEAYRKLGRTEKAAMLRHWLERGAGAAEPEPRERA